MQYTNPYSDVDFEQTEWLRANFHTHAGDPHYGISPLEAVTSYKEAGYHVWGISNHNSKALELLDPDDLAAYEEESGVTILNGYEYGYIGKHIVCMHCTSVFQDRTDYQGAIDQCTAEGGFSVIAHPNIGVTVERRFAADEIAELHGYLGIEILNTGKTLTRGFFGLTATNVWDAILSGGTLAWGFADDDFHRAYHLGRGWNTIFAPDASRESVLAAVYAGRFYCSNGLELVNLEFDGAAVTVEAESKDWAGSPNRYEFVGPDGATLLSAVGRRASYSLTGEEAYVRIKASSESGASLWTQPIVDLERFADSPAKLAIEAGAT